MKAREMYMYAKRYNCIYSDSKIKDIISNMGSIKRWEPEEVIRSGQSQGIIDYCVSNNVGIFYNRIEHIYMDTNFNKLVQHNNCWMTEKEFNDNEQINLFNAQIQRAQETSVDDGFTAQERERVDRIIDENTRRFYSYGRGNFIYENLGVFKDGEDDNSPTIGFEIETNLDLGCNMHKETIAKEYVDYCCGHIESDASISGIEFNSNIFTWKKLKKIKPAIAKQLQSFVDCGLVASSGAGLHIHIGRNAFVNEASFRKFYYLINLDEMKNFWEIIARRPESDYASYRRIQDGNYNNLIDSIVDYRSDHNVAVNQQHRKTIEVRIFQSTLSVDALYGCIEVLINLLNFCNTNEEVFTCNLLFTGDYASKYKALLGDGSRGLSLIMNRRSYSMTFLNEISRDALQELVNRAMQSDNITEAMSLLQRYQAQTGGNC